MFQLYNPFGWNVEDYLMQICELYECKMKEKFNLQAYLKVFAKTYEI